MSSKSNGISGSHRKLLEAAFTSYLRVAMRKHSLDPAVQVAQDPSKMTDVELEAAVVLLKDLAHLPPG